VPRKHREVLAGLTAKGFSEEKQRKQHIHFIYEDLQGRTTIARTMISHDAGGSDIDDRLLGKMARQVGLNRKEFEDLVDCPMSREQFDAKVAGFEENQAE
jgi:predicted RNA binding protein YcfA (HicA-like mRNA interferase family)